MIFDHTYNLKTDVWALGSCLVTVSDIDPAISDTNEHCHRKAISGVTPFQNLNGQQTVVAVSRGQLPSPQTHSGLTPALWGIVARCWILDPSQRPTAREIAEAVRIVAWDY